MDVLKGLPWYKHHPDLDAIVFRDEGGRIWHLTSDDEPDGRLYSIRYTEPDGGEKIFKRYWSYENASKHLLEMAIRNYWQRVKK